MLIINRMFRCPHCDRLPKLMASLTIVQIPWVDLNRRAIQRPLTQPNSLCRLYCRVSLPSATMRSIHFEIFRRRMIMMFDNHSTPLRGWQTRTRPHHLMMWFRAKKSPLRVQAAQKQSMDHYIFWMWELVFENLCRFPKSHSSWTWLRSILFG